MMNFERAITQERIDDPVESETYTLHKLLFFGGMISTILGGIIFNSLLAMFAFFVLFLSIGLIWRINEPPILVFAIFYQWIFVVCGYFYKQITGRFPLYSEVGDLDYAIFLSLIGFVVIALGIRSGFKLMEPKLTKRIKILKTYLPQYNLRRLFYYVVIVYIINWFIEISPMRIFFKAAQVIYALLSFREVLFVMLWYVILRQKKGFLYGFAATAVVMIPLFATTRSMFKIVFFFILIVLFTEWKPWSRLSKERRRSHRLLVTTFIIAFGLIFMGIFWEGAVKPAWRRTYIQGSPIEKVKAFYRISSDAISEPRLNNWFEALVARVSSIEQFSLVLKRVPSIIPHEDGRLTMKAIEHILKPRILFPNKPILWDSALTMKYAGLFINPGTSVGIGYMAEFYVDFGVPGMFIPIFFYGMLLGVIYGIFMLRSPSFDLFAANVTVIFANHFFSFEGNFAKLLGGILMTSGIFYILMSKGGIWLHNKLLVQHNKLS